MHDQSHRQYDNSYELGIVLCLYTGLRIGEICALTWGNIDTKNAVLSVRHTLPRIKNPSGNSKTKIIITEPKSRKSIRDIPLPPNMLGRLSKMKQHRNDNDYFLTGRNRIIEPRSYQYHYERLLKAADVPYIKFHSLRSTFATTCIFAHCAAQNTMLVIFAVLSHGFLPAVSLYLAGFRCTVSELELCDFLSPVVSAVSLF